MTIELTHTTKGLSDRQILFEAFIRSEWPSSRYTILWLVPEDAIAPFHPLIRFAFSGDRDVSVEWLAFNYALDARQEIFDAAVEWTTIERRGPRGEAICMRLVNAVRDATK